ncbi:MAG TPA: hypothetical protein VGL74_13420, partial [Terriglobales bacterium]
RLFIWAGLGSKIMILSLWAFLIIAVVLLDSMRNRKLHPAFGVGASLTVIFLYFAYFGSLTAVWQRLAAGAVR